MQAAATQRPAVKTAHLLLFPGYVFLHGKEEGKRTSTAMETKGLQSLIVFRCATRPSYGQTCAPGFRLIAPRTAPW